MGKNSKQESAEQLREHRRKLEEERRAKEKRQNRILIGTTCGILAVIIAIIGIALISSNIKKKKAAEEERKKQEEEALKNQPITLGDPIIGTSDATYAATTETTEYVRLTVRYVDDKLAYRQGEIVVKLNAEAAPITVANFQKLVGEGFYNGLSFHRVSSGFMIQGGDPDGDGTGGSGTNIKGEFSANGVQNTISHKRGVISMARSGNNTSGFDTASSQFFIVHATSTRLDGQYAAFGEVVSGMDTVDGVASTPVKYNSSGTEKSSPINPVTLVKAEFVTKAA